MNERILGVRGNREYSGADPNAEPHLFTNVVECRNCGFIYTNPQINGVEFLEAEHYNNPETYQSDAGDDNTNQMYLHRLAFIKNFVSHGTLLDVGAGKGVFVAAAAENGFEAVGVEPSPRFCEFAKERFNATVYNGLLETCEELKGRKFDVITLHHVFEHVETPHELLENLKEFLNDDGIVYLEVPNTQSLTTKLVDVYFRVRGRNWSCRLSPLHPPFHKYGYNPKSLSFILKKHGWKILKTATFSAFSRSFSENLQTANLRNLAFKSAIRTVDLLGNRDMLAFVVKK
ncbi:MAG: class I SAM-dependent methyltransferase [Acidobacteriota bacterium]|nr:class I SAM-dependent methyltransferase [Acidobacteriota bacterium]